MTPRGPQSRSQKLVANAAPGNRNYAVNRVSKRDLRKLIKPLPDSPVGCRRSRLAPLGLAVFFGCSALTGRSSPAVPDDEARHRAALAQLVVVNRTDQLLTIAYRMTTPQGQEVVLGSVAAGARGRVAPVPAGEPIVLLARRADGAELTLPARSYPLDAEWIWEIPTDAAFRKS